MRENLLAAAIGFPVAVLAGLAIFALEPNAKTPAPPHLFVAAGEWMTCPGTNRRIARVAKDIMSGDPVRSATFMDWQTPRNCEDGSSPAAPCSEYSGAMCMHVGDSWRPRPPSSSEFEKLYPR